MRKNYQNGSLMGFIVVGVLLALVVIGGLYGLNRYNAQQAAKTVSTDSDKQSSSKSSDSPRTADPKNDDSTSDSSATTDTSSGSGAANSTSKSTSDTTATNTGGASTQANLPHTGPSDTAFSVIALALISFAATHYVRSRHATTA
jgi:cytoskeletal protein RodZ